MTTGSIGITNYYETIKLLPEVYQPIFQKMLTNQIVPVMELSGFENDDINEYHYSLASGRGKSKTFFPGETDLGRTQVTRERAAGQIILKTIPASTDYLVGMTNREQIEEDLMNQAMITLLQDLDDLPLYGEPDNARGMKIYGLLNHPDIVPNTSIKPWGISPAAGGATGQEIIDQIRELWIQMASATLWQFEPDTIAISAEKHAMLMRPWSEAGFAYTSILQAINDTIPQITKIVPMGKLSQKGVGGSGIMFLMKSSPDCFFQPLAIRPKYLRDTVQGLATNKHFVMKAGGLELVRKNVIEAIDGI